MLSILWLFGRKTDIVFLKNVVYYQKIYKYKNYEYNPYFTQN
jgi:hypothetical protein